MKKLAVGVFGLGLAFAPAVFAQNQRANKNMDPDMQRAIQFQHQKDVDDARQAAIEKRHPTVVEPGPGGAKNLSQDHMSGHVVADQGPANVEQENSADRQSADREDTNQLSRSSASTFRTEPTPSELRQAVQWEHHKDAAAAQQASKETQPSNSHE